MSIKQNGGVFGRHPEFNTVQTEGAAEIGGGLTVDGQAIFSAGTAAAPGISFSGDEDTGIRRSNTNQLQMVAGETGVAYLNGLSQFGVGAVPTNALTVADEGTVTIADFYSSGNTTMKVRRAGVTGEATLQLRASTGGAANILSDVNLTMKTLQLDKGVNLNNGGHFRPTTDNTQTLGLAAYRWAEIFCGNATINTSDGIMKQDVRPLDAAEQAVAKEIKSLLRAFRWKDAVEEKGDDARIHFGVIAQDVAAAFTAQGLDPHRYAMFCEDVWYEAEVTYDDEPPQIMIFAEGEQPDGATRHSRFGVRYSELLAFVISAI